MGRRTSPGSQLAGGRAGLSGPLLSHPFVQSPPEVPVAAPLPHEYGVSTLSGRGCCIHFQVLWQDLLN